MIKRLSSGSLSTPLSSSIGSGGIFTCGSQWFPLWTMHDSECIPIQTNSTSQRGSKWISIRISQWILRNFIWCFQWSCSGQAGVVTNLEILIGFVVDVRVDSPIICVWTSIGIPYSNRWDFQMSITMSSLCNSEWLNRFPFRLGNFQTLGGSWLNFCKDSMIESTSKAVGTFQWNVKRLLLGFPQGSLADSHTASPSKSGDWRWQLDLIGFPHLSFDADANGFSIHSERIPSLITVDHIELWLNSPWNSLKDFTRLPVALSDTLCSGYS